MKVRPIPCAECPWAKDTPPGRFSAERYEALRDTTGEPGNEVPLGAAMFACHKSAEGKELPCAGWLASVGYHSITVRFNVMQGAIPVSALSPGEDWPELFKTYEEMEAAQSG